MLGLPPSHQSALSLYRQGKPLGMSRDLLDRVGHILSIHKNLRIIFPKNREVVYSWMTRQNLEFSDLSPVEIVRKYGVSGLLMIRAYLDRQRGN